MSKDETADSTPVDPDHCAERPDTRQFALLFKRRFGPLFATQFLGALNDNLFKTALIVLVVFGASTDQVSILTNLAAALFIVPFFLFASAAGQLSDKYDKARIVQLTKAAELLIMTLAALAWNGGNTSILLAILFLMGVQSAFFGPSKYALLPQHLHDSELLGGNAQIEMSTFVAILIGTILGGLLATGPSQHWIAVTIITVSILGLLCSLAIPAAPSLVDDLEIDWNPLRSAFHLFSHTRKHHYRILLSILGISWFWLFGAVFLTQIPNYVVTDLYGGPELVTAFLGCFTIGIGLGALLCDRLSGHKVEIGLVPLGSIGLSLFAAHLSTLTVPSTQVAYDLSSFLDVGGLTILIDLVGMTLFGGLFIVPLYAFVQQQSPPETRARIIALNNILNAVFMVLAALLGVVMLQVVAMSISSLFLTLALMNAAVSIFVFKQVPLFAARFLIWLLSRLLYRVRAVDLQRIPEEGPAILLDESPGSTNFLILASASRRPIRFVAGQRVYRSRLQRFVLQALDAIPPGEPFDAQSDSIREVTRALRKGELVCITSLGEAAENSAFEMLEALSPRLEGRKPVQTIPISITTVAGDHATASEPRPTPSMPLFTRVEIAVGVPCVLHQYIQGGEGAIRR